MPHSISASTPASLFMSRNKRWLPMYVQVVAVIGALVIVESLFELRGVSYEWLIFAALAILTGSFSMKIGSVSAIVTVSDTFFITTALLFGPGPATLSVAVSSFVSSTRRHHARERVAFNTATTAFGMWAGSHVFYLVGHLRPLTQAQVPAAHLILPLLCLTVVYFLLNSGLIAIAIGFDLGRSPVAIWRQHFSWLSVTVFAAASVSLCLALLMYQVSLGALIVVLPLVAVLHITLRSSFGRLEDARSHVAHLDRLYLSTVETLAMAIDAKDDVTHSHVRRVQAYAVGLAKALDVEDTATIKAIEAAALLHDTGKLAVPEHILNKPGKLSPAEFEEMKRHVDVGADILSLVDFPYPVVPIVRCHHENWDGTGYPRGVRGTDIPIGARILSVVDCFDALTSDRPYRSALTQGEAFDILRARSGTMYEPLVVDTFIRVHRDIVASFVETPAQRDVMRQIANAVAKPKPQLPEPVVAPVTAPAASDDVLAFISLVRLASGDATVGDVLALSSKLMTGIAPDVTIAWYILDDASQRLVVMDAAGPAANNVRGATIGLGDGLSGWVAAHRQVIVNSEAALDLGRRARTQTPPLKSSLGVPLVAGESLVGTVTLYSSQRAAFTEDHSRLVQMIAPHIAQAIRTARLAQVNADAPGAPAHADLKLVSRR